MIKHKLLGQVFTPEWIVNEILDSTGFLGSNIFDKYIIDPACGDGAFLKVIVNRIIEILLNQKKTDSYISHYLEKHVYGIEIDNIAYSNCVRNLNDMVNSKLNQKTNIAWKIFNSNTLYEYKNFIGFFDYVVGNPPYIRIHNLDSGTRQLLKKDFIFSKGTIDIYISFFELGFKLLNCNGVLGYITPNSYLHNSSYKDFRKYLKDNKAVQILTDLKANKVFNGFSTYTAITIINFFNNKTSFTYKELVDGKIKEINKINYDVLVDKDWSFASSKKMVFLEKIRYSSNKKVSDFFDVQYGFATLRDKIFISNIKEETENSVLFNGKLIEKDILFKVIKGGTYKGNKKEFKYIIFPYKKIQNRYVVIPEDELKNKYPQTYKYLLSHKEELLKRDIDGGAAWYEFGRSQGIQSMHNEKLVLSTLMKDKIQFYELDKDIFVYSGIFIIKKKNEYSWNIVKDIIQSEEFLKYIKITGKDFSGGYKSITSNQIKNYPTQEINIQANLFN